ncbi:MAG: MFS transporter [Proteobacteria bacterium]|nr:MAG: MFS transporter [Pseudomonadota bacterium]
MTFLIFFKNNVRWLLGGFLLTLFSSFGQTFFISLSAGDIRAEFGLSRGDFGALYMVATLASALTLPKLGRIVDHLSVPTTIAIVSPMLALSAFSMSRAEHVAVLAVTIYALRLFGQGMMTHIAMTAMGRWFSAQRGRAVSIATIGHQAGEAVFPFLFVSVVVVIGWRATWLLAAMVMAGVALPAIWLLMREERTPRSGDRAAEGARVRDWTRDEVLRDPLFYLALLGVLAPPFIGTTIFFHQVYLVELRGWSLEVFATSFAVMSTMTLVCALLAGALVDRFSAVTLLPGFLVPLGLACFSLAAFEGQWSAFAFMALLGVSYGFSSILFGSVWPEIYGVRHLGAIRSVIMATMVFATALGPGVTGQLIDMGVDYPLQIAGMGAYCLVASLIMRKVSRVAARRRFSPPAVETA